MSHDAADAENALSNKLSITDVSLEGQRVLIRVDFNVPFAGGKISSTQRIDASLPTIKYALEHGAKVRRVCAERSPTHG